MARYGMKTRSSSDCVIEKAVAYFGREGLGLEMKEQAACCATFEGGGGYVSVMVSSDGDRTDVELTTREWDYDVKQFMRQLGS